MATARKSNIELLRIVSIVMVLIVHLDGASLGLPEPMGNIAAVSSRDWWRLVVESFAIIGVNCFTLISGYFGIKAHWRGFAKFAATRGFKFISYAVWWIRQAIQQAIPEQSRVVRLPQNRLGEISKVRKAM
ncbi:MAG: hypothetical protein IKZ14_09830, partial [Muribaculaceae bacterium]|nr:hypothetical protein [Muribaculaceae bacterium]